MAKAREAAGGKDGKDVDIARLLKISPAAVSRWGGVVPPDRAIEIETLTEGRVTRHDIRPDYFGAAPVAPRRQAKPKPTKPSEAASRGASTFRPKEAA